MNGRVEADKCYTQLQEEWNAIVSRYADTEGFKVSLVQESLRVPKPFDAATEQLFSDIKSCAEPLGVLSHWKATGGVCDGNILASCGVPTIDTLGALGGAIHTPDEYLKLSSLVAKAKVLALYLMRLGKGELPLPGR